jgi:hypothetical protein
MTKRVTKRRIAGYACVEISVISAVVEELRERGYEYAITRIDDDPDRMADWLTTAVWRDIDLADNKAETEAAAIEKFCQEVREIISNLDLIDCLPLSFAPSYGKPEPPPHKITKKRQRHAPAHDRRAPAPSSQWSSVIEAPVGTHSEKPEIFLKMIEEYFPNLPKIELNRRGPPHPGWDAWATKRVSPRFRGEANDEQREGRAWSCDRSDCAAGRALAEMLFGP